MIEKDGRTVPLPLPRNPAEKVPPSLSLPGSCPSPLPSPARRPIFYDPSQTRWCREDPWDSAVKVFFLATHRNGSLVERDLLLEVVGWVPAVVRVQREGGGDDAGARDNVPYRYRLRPVSSLQGAVEVARSGDEIAVSGTVFVPCTADVPAGKRLRLKGVEGSGASLTAGTKGGYPLLRVLEEGVVFLSNLSLVSDLTALQTTNAYVSLHRCDISGGVDVTGGTVTARRTTIKAGASKDTARPTGQPFAVDVKGGGTFAGEGCHVEGRRSAVRVQQASCSLRDSKVCGPDAAFMILRESEVSLEGTDVNLTTPEEPGPPDIQLSSRARKLCVKDSRLGRPSATACIKVYANHQVPRGAACKVSLIGNEFRSSGPTSSAFCVPPDPECLLHVVMRENVFLTSHAAVSIGGVAGGSSFELVGNVFEQEERVSLRTSDGVDFAASSNRFTRRASVPTASPVPASHAPSIPSIPYPLPPLLPVT